AGAPVPVSTIDGVKLFAGTTGNTVGGTAAGAGNLISGNGSSGVTVSDSGTTGNVVQGNDVGTDANGHGFIPGTVHWYRAEGNALDAVGEASGTIQNGVPFAAGKVGQAFHFGGSTGFISAPALDYDGSHSGTNFAGAFALDAWIN